MDFLKDISPRDYQKQIFETCKNANCLVVLPTGLGKTLISLMLTIHRMQEFPGDKVLFLAPTKPLAEQQMNAFQKQLPELFGSLELFTGEVNAEKRKKIWKSADIIFSTPQCIANDLRKNLYNLEEVCLLIEDEAHRCIKNYDYNFIAQKYKSQSAHPRIIGLTASPGSEKEKVQQICRNLSIEKLEVRTREDTEVKKYLQELEFEKQFVDFPPAFQDIKHAITKLLNSYIEELKVRGVLYGIANKGTIIKLQKEISAAISRGNKNFNYFLAASACGQTLKLQHSLELLETQTLSGFNKYLKELFDQASKKQSKGVVKLVAQPEFNFAYMLSNELLSKNQEHPKLQKLIELVEKENINKKSKIIVFTQFRNTASEIVKIINSKTPYKAIVFVGQAKKNGTGLTQKDQKRIIEEFSRGEVDILVATSIGEEGLDIPEVNAVIFYEPIPSAIRKIQRAGRTARLMQGKLIILITRDTRDESNYYISRSREKKMYKTIGEIKDDLDNIQEKINEVKEVQKTL